MEIGTIASTVERRGGKASGEEPAEMYTAVHRAGTAAGNAASTHDRSSTRLRSAPLLGLLVLLVQPPPAAAEPDYSKDPVLMVHGYVLGEALSWTWMKDALLDAGWPPDYLFSLQFDNVVGCNPDHAQVIAAEVQKILAATGRDKVDLLSHSMGGLDTRYYIKYLCGYKYVRDYVSIAGTHQGTVAACADQISCGAAQMCVAAYDNAWMQNDFLLALNFCDMTPWDKIRYTSIWTPHDEIVVPPHNSVLDGAHNIELTALVEHALILASPETLSYVIPALDGAGLNDNLPTAAPPCVTLCPDPPPAEPSAPEPDDARPPTIEEPVEPHPDAPDAAAEPPEEPEADLARTALDAPEPTPDPVTVVYSVIPRSPAPGCSPAPPATPPSMPLLLAALLVLLALLRKARTDTSA